MDTHVHILPGIDDGPATLDDAVVMIQTAAAAGTVRMIATPHANYQFAYDVERVRELCAELQAQAPEGLQLHTGCEMHLSYENVQTALADPRRLSLNGSRYLLVEFPEFFDGPSLGQVLGQLLALGLVPVLAHPERNANFQQHQDLLHSYLRRGCITQVTGSSFAGRFGRTAQQFSHELLEANLIALVASDGHSARQRSPSLQQSFALVAEEAGEEVARALFIDNPGAVALDRELVLRPEPPAEKKKSSFWSRLRATN